MPGSQPTLPEVQPFTPLESVMWHMDSDPSLHSRLVSVVRLSSVPDRAVLRDRLERISRSVPRFRHRVAAAPLPGLRPHWELDPHFDMDFHLRVVSLADASDPNGEDPVFGFAARVGQDTFHPGRPLWRVYLVTGLPDGAAALVMKVHHVVTDGIGGIRMAALLFDLDETGRAPDELGPMPEVRIPRPRAAADRFLQGLTQEVDQVGGLLNMAYGAVRGGVDPLATAHTAVESALAALQLVDLPIGRRGSHVVSPRDRYVTLHAPLDALKRAGHVGGGKVNDAYLAVLVGGMHRYQERVGAVTPTLAIGMPVNTRARDHAEHGGNEFASKRFTLPAQISDPAERIAAIRAASQRQQNRGSHLVSQTLVQAASRVPGQVVRNLTGSLVDGLDMNTTNVPGVPVPLHMGGARIESFHAFIPRLRAPLSSALMSYAGSAHIGLNMDPAAIPDPLALTDCIRTELAEVLTLGGSAV